MTKDPVRFKIIFTTAVTFRDRAGAITHQFKVGDTLDASYDAGDYFVTSIGGIYKDEAKRI